MTERGRFSPEQSARLLRPIRPERVFQTQGHSNLAAWEVSAHLTRLFGYGGWGKEIISIEEVLACRGKELGLGKDGWYVTYRCALRLSIFNPAGQLAFQNDDVSTGSAQNQPSLQDAHDLAFKNAVSGALKRCAKDLGDQYGLSLYNKGSQRAVVQFVLGLPDVEESTEADVEVLGEGTDQAYEPGEEPFDEQEPSPDTPYL